MRKLASIQVIKEINSIPDADQIEVCSILGWKVVSRKGEFKVGDLVIYLEEDAQQRKDSAFDSVCFDDR